MAQPEGRPLSPREMDVLELVAAGMANKEIAVALGLSPNTVKGYIESAMGRLGVHNRTAAAAWWVRHSSQSANTPSDLRPPDHPDGGG